MKNKLFILLTFITLLAPAEQLVGMESRDEKEERVELSKALNHLGKKSNLHAISNIFVFIDFDRQGLIKLALCGSFFYNIFKNRCGTHPFSYFSCYLNEEDAKKFFNPEYRDQERLTKFKRKIFKWEYPVRLVIIDCPEEYKTPIQKKIIRLLNENKNLTKEVFVLAISYMENVTRPTEKLLDLTGYSNVKRLEFFECKIGKEEFKSFTEIIESRRKPIHIVLTNITLTIDQNLPPNKYITKISVNCLLAPSKITTDDKNTLLSILDKFPYLNRLSIKHNQSICNFSSNYPFSTKFKNLTNLRLEMCNRITPFDFIFLLEISPQLKNLYIDSKFNNENFKIQDLFSTIHHTSLRNFTFLAPVICLIDRRIGELKTLDDFHVVFKAFPMLVYFECNFSRERTKINTPTKNGKVTNIHDGVLYFKTILLVDTYPLSKYIWRKK